MTWVVGQVVTADQLNNPEFATLAVTGTDPALVISFPTFRNTGDADPLLGVGLFSALATWTGATKGAAITGQSVIASTADTTGSAGGVYGGGRNNSTGAGVLDFYGVLGVIANDAGVIY